MQEKKDDITNYIVISITFLITVFVGIYIYWKMRKVKAILLEEQSVRLAEKREAREMRDAQHAPGSEPAFI